MSSLSLSLRLRQNGYAVGLVVQLLNDRQTGGRRSHMMNVSVDITQKKSKNLAVRTLNGESSELVRASSINGRSDTPSISSGIGTAAMWRTVGARSMETTDNESISMLLLLLLLLRLLLGVVGSLLLGAMTSNGTRISVS